MDLTVPTYLVYVVASVALTFWVGRTLFTNGSVFLVEVFDGDERLADSVNHLLVAGFYLISLGAVTLALRFGQPVGSLREAVQVLSVNVGAVLIVLGVLHFVNLYAFGRMRRRRAQRALTAPPVPPVPAVPPVPPVPVAGR